MVAADLPRRGFTPKFIESLRWKPGPKAKNEVSDPVTPGLRLRVLPPPSTGKVFRWAVRGADGKLRWITLGRWSASETPAHLTLQATRTWLQRLKAAHAAGPDQLAKVERELRDHLAPRPALASTPQGETVAQAAEKFLKTIAKSRKRPEDAAYIIEKNILPFIGAVPLMALRKRDCVEVVERVVARGAPVFAGRVLSLLRQLLDHAENRIDDFTNPSAKLKAANLGVENNVRDRWLSEEELPVYWRSFDPDPPGSPPRSVPEVKTALAFRLLLLTAVRSQELRLARWRDVDLDNANWVIPVCNQKLTLKAARTAKDFHIPLPRTAVALFAELKRISDEEHKKDGPADEATKRSRPVLGSDESNNGLYSDKALCRAANRLWSTHPTMKRWPPVKPHDLRRTVRSHLSRLGVAPFVAERVLNHSLGGIIKIYDVYDYERERLAALEKWALYLQRLIEPESTNVVFMPNVGAER